jgi:hypothetical protein
VPSNRLTLFFRFFFFGKPYFSCDTLIQSIKFDPPPYQKTSTFFLNPPDIDPSDPHSTQPHHLHHLNIPNINNPTSNPKKTPKKSKKGPSWPPDPSKLYYSPYSPSTGILSLDSCKGSSWHWTQDRWYVDMRGDVDEEGWEYAFYWGGRYRWIGGNWHGKHVFLHAWVRRRRWVRKMERLPVRFLFFAFLCPDYYILSRLYSCFSAYLARMLLYSISIALPPMIPLDVSELL